MPIELGSTYGKMVIDTRGVVEGLKKAVMAVKGFRDETEKGAKGGEKSIGGLKAAWQDAAKDIAKYTGIIAGVGVTLKKAFDLGEQGAQAMQLARSFDRLLLSVGAAPDLLEQLREGSRNTISDMELMASTSTLLAGTQGDLATALANATPELIEIAKAANALNPTLGDTTFLYDSLARGIKRASPMILDNLGIIVNVEAANKAYAESIGVAVDALTVEQQKIALLNGVLEQGQVLTAQAGEGVDSLTDGYARMDAAAQNLKDTLTGALAPGLGKSADAAAILLDTINVMIGRWNELDEEQKQGVILAGATGVGFSQVGRVIRLAQAATKAYDLALRDMNTDLEKGLNPTEELNMVIQELTRTLTGGTSGTGEFSRGVDTVTDSLGKNNDVAGAFYSHLLSTTEALPRGTQAWEVYAQSVRDTGTAAEEAQPSVRDILTTLDSDIASPIGAFIDDLKFMIAGGGEIAGEFKGISDALASGQITPEQAQGMLENLFVEAQNISVEAGLATATEAATSVSEQLGIPMDEAYLKLKDIGTEWDAMAAIDHTITMNIEANIMSGQDEWAFLRKLVDDRYFSITIEADLLGGGVGGGWENASGSSGTRRPGGPGDPAVGAGPNVGLAEGGYFVVPPGYPDDSYLVGVTSGERVDVRQPGQGGGDLYLSIGDINIAGPGDPVVVRQAVVDGGNQVLEAARSKGLR